MGLLGEVAVIGLSVLVFLGYEFYLHRAGTASPMSVARRAHAAIRAQRVGTVVDHPGTEILVIQTLRNSIMAASFMASTAVLALIGAMNLSGFSSATSPLWHMIGGHTAEEMMQTRRSSCLSERSSRPSCSARWRFDSSTMQAISSQAGSQRKSSQAGNPLPQPTSIGPDTSTAWACGSCQSVVHMRATLGRWAHHYTAARPHMSLGRGVPDPPSSPAPPLNRDAASDRHPGCGGCQVGAGRVASRVLVAARAGVIEFLRSTARKQGSRLRP
jgi:hypothetical protein